MTLGCIKHELLRLLLLLPLMLLLLATATAATATAAATITTATANPKHYYSHWTIELCVTYHVFQACIAFEQVSCWGTSTRLLVLHEFACICKYDNYIVVALQALGKQSNTELCTCNFRA